MIATGMADTPTEGKGRRPRKRPLNPEHRDTRTALILQAKLSGKRILEIAEEFNISKATVHRSLNDAQKMGLLTQARDWLSLKAVPLSLAAIEEALVMGDIPTKVDTAFRVLDGLGITGKHATLTVEQGKNTETFESFRETVIQRVTRPVPAGDPADPAKERNGVVDGHLLPPAPEGSQTGSEGDRPDHLSGPGGGDSADRLDPDDTK